MQDMEFTVERGKLFMLQTRNAKRSPVAAVKVAGDMVVEGLLSKEEAVMRVLPPSLTPCCIHSDPQARFSYCQSYPCFARCRIWRSHLRIKESR